MREQWYIFFRNTSSYNTEASMCGRFSRFTGQDIIINRFGVQKTKAPPLHSYNIAPSTQVPIIKRENPLVIEQMKWGYIPFYTKDLSKSPSPINARDDSLDKNMYKDSLQKRRILIPANGFYEWKKIHGFKQPYHIHLPDYELFAFGGIYSTWNTPNGTEIDSFAIITTSPNGIMENIHDRMPLILPRNKEQVWMDMDQEIEEIKSMIIPYEGELITDPVSTFVNSPKNDTETCINPIGKDAIGKESDQKSLDEFF